MAEDDYEVIQLHDRTARLGGDDAVLRADGPIAGRARDNQVAGLRIGEDILDPPQTGQILHRLIAVLAKGRAELNLLLQSVEGNHSQRRAAVYIVLSAALLSSRAKGGQIAGSGFAH